MTQQFYNIGNIPLQGAGFGIQTNFGVTLPPGANVAAYVRSTGLQSGDNAAIVDRLVLTLAAGLARCRSGMGDYVIVLPGHSESVTDATMLNGLVAGTNVLGIGQGSTKPTFRWTATGAKWAVSVADCSFSGLKLRLEGANGVVKAIEVLAANSTWTNNEFQVASGASNKATIAFEVGSGADGTTVALNWWYGTATHNVTDGLKVVAAVDRLRILNNLMDFSATAGNGNIHLTAAATKTAIGGNIIQNDHTASTATVAVDAVAATGMIWDTYSATINNGTAANQGIIIQGGGLLRCFQGFSSDEPAKSGTLNPSAVAT